MADVLDISDHSDDLARNRGPKTRATKCAGSTDNSLADRILVRPEAPRHGFTDDHNIWCTEAVAFRELTPSYQWETHGPKVGRTDADVSSRKNSAVFLGLALDGEARP
jgi:hypothetical protein